MLSREETAKIGRYIPGFDVPQNVGHREKATFTRMGYDPVRDGPKEIHHIMGLQDHLRPFVQGLPEDQQQGMMRYLRQKGVIYGDDAENLIALNKAPHKALHRALEDKGIDSNLEKDKVAILNKIANLPFEERKIAADVYAEQIFPAIAEEMQALGLPAPNQAKNAELYQRAIMAEALEEERLHSIAELKAEVGSKPTKGSIDKLMALTNAQVGHRFAGKKFGY